MPLAPFTGTLAQMAAALQAATIDELGAYILELEQLRPSLRGRFVCVLGGYGSEVSPLGLAQRQEWLQLIRQGKAFTASTQQAAVAAQNSGLQLFNQVGSGVRVLVYMASAAPGVAGDVFFQIDPVESGMGLTALPTPLLSGNPAPVCHFRQGSVAALPGGVGIVHRATAPAANGNVQPPVPQGFICELREGFGFDIFNNTVNDTLKFTVHYAEVSGTYP